MALVVLHMQVAGNELQRAAHARVFMRVAVLEDSTKGDAAQRCVGQNFEFHFFAGTDVARPLDQGRWPIAPRATCSVRELGCALPQRSLVVCTA